MKSPDYKLIADMLEASECNKHTLTQMAEQVELLRTCAPQYRPFDEHTPRDGTMILAKTDSGHPLIVQWCVDGYWRSSNDHRWDNLVEWMLIP